MFVLQYCHNYAFIRIFVFIQTYLLTGGIINSKLKIDVDEFLFIIYYTFLTVSGRLIAEKLTCQGDYVEPSPAHLDFMQ